MKKSRLSLIYSLTLFISTAIISLLFSYKFKIEQLSLFKAEIIAFYPKLFILPIFIISFFIFGSIILLLTVRMIKLYTPLHFKYCLFINCFLFLLYSIICYFTEARFIFIFALVQLVITEVIFYIRNKAYKIITNNYHIFFLYVAMMGILLPSISPFYMNTIILSGRWDLIYDYYSFILTQGYHNDIALWSPANFAGAVPHNFTMITKGLLLNAMAMIFKISPINPISTIYFFKILIFLLLILGSFGTYLLLSKGFELKKQVSFIGGLLFVFVNFCIFGGLNNEFPMHFAALCFLPISLYFLQLGIKTKSIIYYFMCGICSVVHFEIFPTHAPSYYMMPIIIGVYFIVHLINVSKSIKSTVMISLCFLSGIFISSINYFLPFIISWVNNIYIYRNYIVNGISWAFPLFLLNSFLVSNNFELFIKAPGGYIFTISPDGYYYLGSFFITILLSTILILFNIKKLKINSLNKRSYIIFLTLSFVLFLILLGKNTVIIDFLFRKINILFRYPDRVAQYWIFLLVVVFSINLHYVTEFKKKGIACKYLIFIFIIVAILTVVSLYNVYYYCKMDNYLFKVVLPELILLVAALSLLLIVYYYEYLRLKLVYIPLLAILTIMPFIIFNHTGSIISLYFKKNGVGSYYQYSDESNKKIKKNILCLPGIHPDFKRKPFYNSLISKAVINYILKNESARVLFLGVHFTVYNNVYCDPVTTGYGLFQINTYEPMPQDILRKIKLFEDVLHPSDALMQILPKEGLEHFGIQYIVTSRSIFEKNKINYESAGFSIIHSFRIKILALYDDIILLVNKSIPGPVVVADGKGRINSYAIGGNYVYFDIECESNECSILYKDYYNFGWHAFDYNVPISLGLNSDLYKTFNIKKGRHKIWMEYRPLHAYLTIIIFVLSIFVVMLYYIHMHL